MVKTIVSSTGELVSGRDNVNWYPDEETKRFLLSEDTMETMMEVDVEELCTRTVHKMPSIRPAMGLLNSTVLVMASPAALPATTTSVVKICFMTGLVQHDIRQIWITDLSKAFLEPSLERKTH